MAIYLKQKYLNLNNPFFFSLCGKNVIRLAKKKHKIKLTRKT